MAECGYCYAQNRLTASQTALLPEALDWRQPLYDCLTEGTADASAERWLLFLGGYRDAAQKLSEVKEARRRAAEAELRRREDIYQQIRDLSTETAEWKEASVLAFLLTTIPEDAVDRGMAALLKTKQDRIRNRTTLEKIRTLRSGIAGSDQLRQLEVILGELTPLADFPEALAAIGEAQTRKSELLRLQMEREKALARARRRRVCRLWAAGAAALLTAALLIALSWHVWQPRQLASARTLAQAEQYEAAVSAYAALANRWFFPNPDVRAEAQASLPTLRSAWADTLAADGDWESAIRQYHLAGNTEAERAARSAFAEELERNGEEERAIAQLREVPDSDARVAALYARLTLREYSAGDYAAAAEHGAKADAALLAAEGVTAETIYRDWGLSLAAEGNTEEAIRTLEKAGNSPEVLLKLSELRAALDDERNRRTLQRWAEAMQNGQEEAAYNELQTAGAEITTVDGQLRYWTALSNAGADLTRVFPDGALVTDLTRPEMTPAEADAIDTSRPLVLIRREKDYMISMSYSLSKSWPLHDDSAAAFQWRLMPEYWLRLPAERRASSLADCTCILLTDLTYRYLGNTLRNTLSWDFISTISRTGFNSRIRTTPWKKFSGIGSFPTFSAVSRLMLWAPGDNHAALLNEREKNPPKYRETIDFTSYLSMNSTASNLGLSGSFDSAWTSLALEEAFSDILNKESAP